VNTPPQPQHRTGAYSWFTCRLLEPSPSTQEPYEAQRGRDGSIRQSAPTRTLLAVPSLRVAAIHSHRQGRITRAIATGCCCWMPAKRLPVSYLVSGVKTGRLSSPLRGDQVWAPFAGPRWTPSGCGNPTTLRMLAALETVTSGEVYIGEQCVNDVSPRDRDVAMVFQSYALYPT